MTVSNIFHTDEELAKYFGEHFMCMLDRLRTAYEKRCRRVSLSWLRAASLAFAFYGAAMDGDAAVMSDFDSMLHGESTDVIVLEGQPFRVSDDDPSACMVWDLAALMLEESKGVEQLAFDLVGEHVWMAYNLEQQVQASRPQGQAKAADAKPTVQVEMKAMDASVPAFSDEQAAWMLDHAKRSSQPNALDQVKELLYSNMVERYHPELARRIQEAEEEIRKRNEANGIGQLVLRQFNNVGDMDAADLKNLI